MKFEDKVAVVTGSSQGIGKAIALRFAADGAKVIVNYCSNADLADDVVDEIATSGGEAVAIQCDVRQRGDTDRLLAESVSAFGKVDILISNAGLVIDRAFIDSTDDDWAAAIETNLRGFFNVTQSFLPHMIERQYGRVVVTASVISDVADFGGNQYSVCAASKGGIVSMMRPIAAEVAQHGITVNAVSPGYIATEMMHHIDAAGVDAAVQRIPMRRKGKPEEVAAAMAFMASDEAAFITGQTLRVNGGMAMG
ncbi:MAG: 3-oxoacyl-ACP reductase family protein [Pseudomonadota bacterium]